MRTKLVSILTVVAGLSISQVAVLAQTPVGTAFTYQGLLKQSGAPVNDTADFVLHLYDAETGGNQIGPVEAVYNVPVVDGLFTVELDFDDNAFNGDARWLEIAVRSPAGGGGFTTLSPRQPLNAASYALYALNAPGGSSPWEITGSDIYYVVGNVGVGTSSPAHPLHVQASGSTVIHAEATATSGFAYGVRADIHTPFGVGVSGEAQASSGSALGVRGGSQSPDGAGVMGYNDAEEGNSIGVRGITGSSTGFGGYFEGRGYFSGNVGIGEDTPQAKLHIGGTPGTDGIMFPDGTLQTTAATGAGGLWTPSGSNIYYDAGNVGIGWSGAAYPLDVRSSGGTTLHVRNTSSGGAINAISSGGSAIYASALGSSGMTKGVSAEAFNPDGFAIYGVNEGEEGNSCAIYGETYSPDGFAGYFVGGRNYFEGNVGIGTSSPSERLHVVGVVKTTGFQLSTGAATGRVLTSDASGTATWQVPSSSPWTGTGPDVYYDAGNVGIGTSSPAERLHVVGDTQIDGNLGIGTAPIAFAAIDVVFDNYFGIRVERTAAANGAAIFGTATAASGSSDGVRGFSNSPDGAGVYGNGAGKGVKGYSNTEAGIGVVGTHAATTGDAPGVYGTTDSTTDLASGVKGEATATSGGSTIGVMGLSHSPVGMGVYGKADYAIGVTMGGYFVSESPNGRGVYGTANGTNSFAGYFAGRGYFSGDVGIGTTSPAAELDVAGTARVDVLKIDGGADLSENLAIEGGAEPGMVVVIDSDRPGALCTSNSPYDRRVAGIISGAGGIRTGMLMSQAGSVADGEHPVALTGRVYCWCDASSGAIEPGDLLTTSDTPGHAMKVTDYARAQGAVIGKAMTSLKEGQGLVLVLVNLQ